MSRLSPWWHILKARKGENIIQHTLSDYLGYDELQFLLLLDIAGLTSFKQKIGHMFKVDF